MAPVFSPFFISQKQRLADIVAGIPYIFCRIFSRIDFSQYLSPRFAKEIGLEKNKITSHFSPFISKDCQLKTNCE
jgi:hypothetical protein